MDVVKECLRAGHVGAADKHIEYQASFNSVRQTQQYYALETHLYGTLVRFRKDERTRASKGSFALLTPAPIKEL